MSAATDALVDAILACNPHTQLATHVKPLAEAVRRERDMKLLLAAIGDLRIEADNLGCGEQLRRVVREVIARADRLEPKGNGS